MLSIRHGLNALFILACAVTSIHWLNIAWRENYLFAAFQAAVPLLALGLLFFRSSAQIERNDFPTSLLVFGHIVSPLLLSVSGSPQIPWQLFLSFLILSGILVMFSYNDLGRSFSLLPAARKIKTCGLYRLVRHPIYAGYSLAVCTIFIAFLTLQNFIVVLLFFILGHFRMNQEEQVLREARDSNYSQYQQEVRYRLFPGIY